ncbi:cytochrome o ubiquinol oxidase subunit IV [Bradyrhizobium sp. JR6.1]
MNVAVAIDQIPQDALPSASEAGPAPKRIVVAYGFWIFLLSDIVMFAALFASYSVLVRSTAGGPTGAQLFNQVTVAIETACLLVSSYTCGLMSLAVNSRRRLGAYLGALITFALGATFLGLEIREFSNMIAIGATPQRSAFLSAFFTLVGCHGLHVTLGLIWLIVMMVQVAVFGFAARVQRRLLCFSLFWHALDIPRLGRGIHGGLSDGSEPMTDTQYERAPGDRPSREMEASAPSEFLIYTIGLFVAVVLTATSFWVANTTLIWPGGVFLGLAVLAIAQMGIHLVFFLHISSGPESTNNVLALAFGVLIVFVVVAGTMWIVADMNANMMMPSGAPMSMRMQH